MSASISLDRVSVEIGGAPILREVSMRVREGERVGLIGASGSGKSMLARAIMGLLPREAHTSGVIAIGDERRHDDERVMASLRGSAVSMIFQNAATALNPVSTIGDQVSLPLRLHYELSREEQRARMLAMLDNVQLERNLAQRYPHELSGGQQQRAGIATALITSPRFVLADEPTTALDSLTQRAIVDMLTSLVDTAGMGMLFITHDFAVLARAVRYAYVMHEGRVVEHGSIEQLLSAPRSKWTQQLVTAAQALSLPQQLQ